MISEQWKAKRAIDEMANAWTHGIGLFLSLAGLVLLVGYASRTGDVLTVGAATIYGLTLVGLYGASTAYHSTGALRRKLRLRQLDHIAIYLLIAGTYTPFTLITLRGGFGWMMCGVVWAAAAAGVALKLIYSHRASAFSTATYLVMGWMALLLIRPLWYALPLPAFWLLVFGGLSYTAGIWFFVRQKRFLHHAVWHLFVLAGSALHFAAVLGWVIR